MATATRVNNKPTYILLIVGNISFCEDGFENLCAEKGGWGGISSLDTNLSSDTVNNSCVCNCGDARGEMSGNLNIFSFLSPMPIQSLLSIHSVCVCVKCKDAP